MPRPLLALLLAGLTAAAAPAHFVFVVPAADGKSATVVFSDSLDPDDGVPLDKLKGLTLTAVAADGKSAPVATTPGEAKLTATFPARPRLVAGTLVYGLASKGPKPALLVYHPKAVFGKADPAALAVPTAEADAVPEWTPAGVRFRLLAKGKPVAGAEGSVLRPDGEKEKVTTDADGYTKPFAASGRYGVWLRLTAPTAGDHAGKKYEEVKRYATLVVDHAS